MKSKLTTTVILLSVITLQSCYNPIGRLTVASTRNMDSKTEYVLLAKEVSGKAKTKKSNAMEMAIDKAVSEYKTGEFMKNIVFSVSGSGRKIKVVGDVWGTQPVGEKVNKNVTKTVNASVEFKIGDKVTFKILGKLTEGTILGTNQNTAVVEYGSGLKKEIEYEKLTKIER